MTDQQHPITPSPELVKEWAHMLEQHTDTEVFAQAARWGADQELEACCEWVYNSEYCQPHAVLHLRAARRKPPSLKEQALAALNKIEDKMLGPTIEEKLIRRALEALPE